MKEVNDIYFRFREHCAGSGIICQDDQIIVAYSGGPDSTVLFDLLWRWKNDGGRFNLIAGHYNHKLRPEADAEQRHVETECEKKSIRCVVGNGDVAGEARRRGVSLHVAAREMRYDFLVETALEHLSGINDGSRVTIATGHHRDDQAETVLMRLLNGSGIEGIAGIRRLEVWKGHNDAPIIRPLLDFSRDEIEAYCHKYSLNYVIDESNRDLTYPRNRLRHEIIPLLKSRFGDNVVSGIVRSAGLSRLTADFLSEAVNEAAIKTVTDRNDSEIVLDYGCFSSYLVVLRLKILQQAVQMLAKTDTRITFERFRAVDEYLSTGRTGIVEFGNGIRAVLWKGRIYIYSSFESDWKRLLYPDQTVEIPGFGHIEAILKSREDCPLPPPNGAQYCDYSRIGPGPYTVRPAKKGDRIIPYGMTGRRKISDILREAGLPPHRRAYPVIVSGNQITAVPPLRMAEPFKLTAATQQVVVFRIRREKSKDQILQVFYG